MATARNRQPKAAGPADKGLRVIARHPQGMRRAGRHWPAEPTVIGLDKLTEDEVEALRDEPALIVDEVDVPAAA